MASVEKRRGPTGKVTGFRVKWRTGGTRDGDWDSETFPRQEAAKTFKAEIEANGHRRSASLPRHIAQTGPLTVAGLLDAYLEDRIKRVRSDRTVADYRRDADRWIIPELGHLAADEIDEETVQAWVDGIPRAPKTVANIHGVLSAAFKWGARRRVDGQLLVGKGNPCVGTELPERHRVVRGLRKGEWAILYQAACSVSPDVADLLLFLVGTGWRWSEATALQVHQVDLDAQRPYVEMSAVWRRNAAHQRILVVDQGKSAAAVRRVRLSPRLADMLRRRVTGKGLGDFVFTTATGRPWRYNNFRDRKWTKVLEQAEAMGLTAKPTIHWLRHTQAALLLEEGAPLPGVQRRLGHESITTTVDTYGGLVDDVSPQVLTALDEALFRRAPLRAVDMGDA
jgi:integrase